MCGPPILYMTAQVRLHTVAADSTTLSEPPTTAKSMYPQPLASNRLSQIVSPEKFELSKVT